MGIIQPQGWVLIASIAGNESYLKRRKLNDGKSHSGKFARLLYFNNLVFQCVEQQSHGVVTTGFR